MDKIFLITVLFMFLTGCEKQRPIIIQTTAPIVCDPEKRALTDLLGRDALSSEDFARLRHLSIKLGHSYLRKKTKDPFYAGHERPDKYELVPNPNFKMGPVCR